MFDGYWRTAVEQRVDPIGARLHASGLTANGLTITGVIAAAASAGAIATGRLWLGGILLIVAAVPDLLDGPVAKAAGPTTARGAFFDSTADRVTDTLLMGGVAWHVLIDDGGHVTMLPVAVMAASWLISYQRAKAESLGFDAKGGIMERAERIVILTFGLLVADVLIAVLWVMLVLTLLTSAQRFWKVWQQATDALAQSGQP